MPKLWQFIQRAPAQDTPDPGQSRVIPEFEKARILAIVVCIDAMTRD